jgi:hypothetical protein
VTAPLRARSLRLEGLTKPELVCERAVGGLRASQPPDAVAPSEVESESEKKRNEPGEKRGGRVGDHADEEADGDEDLDHEDDVAGLSESHPAKEATLVCGEVGGQGRVTGVANCAAASQRTREVTPAFAADCFRAPSKRKTLSELRAAPVDGVEAGARCEEDDDGKDDECHGVHGVRFPSLRLR